MCDPATAMFAMSAGSAVAGHQQQAGMAKVQTAMHRMNQTNSITAMGQEQYDLGTRHQQEQEATAQQIQERNLEALAGAASLNARMAETGVKGHSMSALMRDVFTQEGRATSTMRANMQWASQNLATQMVGARTTAIQRMGQTAPGTKPSLIATGLKIGVAGATLANAKGWSMPSFGGGSSASAPSAMNARAHPSTG